jgi:8-oxo-dGTP diphosphatase
MEPVRTCLCLLTRTIGDGSQQVLLGRKKTGLGAGNITGIGGHVEPGETTSQAAARELKEEAGVCVEAAGLRHLAELAFVFPTRPAWDQTISVFRTGQWDGDPAESAEIAPQWFPVTQLPLDEMWDDARYWLPRALAGEHMRGTFTYADDCQTVAHFAVEGRPVLIYIYGPPATGKLTVAEKLADLTGYPLFHNHLTVNAVRSVFPFGTGAFDQVVRRLRLDVFDTAARTGISLIFTNNSAWAGPSGRAHFATFADTAERAFTANGGRTVFVQLGAPLATLEERLSADSRRAHGKLLDAVRLREMVSSLDPSPLHPDDLTIDTATVSPDQAARTIAQYITARPLPRLSGQLR